MIVKAGHRRIPADFRLRVNHRIRQTMKPYISKDHSLTMECKEAAAKLGVTYIAVYFWYDGYTLPNLYNLVNFAELYDVSLDYLLGRTTVKELTRQGHLKVVGK